MSFPKINDVFSSKLEQRVLESPRKKQTSHSRELMPKSLSALFENLTEKAETKTDKRVLPTMQPIENGQSDFFIFKTARKSLSGNSKSETVLENPKRKKNNLPKLNLYTDEKGNTVLTNTNLDIKDGSTILIQKNESLILKELPNGKGNFHRVWLVDGKPGLVIKTLLGDKGPLQVEKSINNTLKSYALLKERESKRGDIQLAKLYNESSILEQGFYVYEYVEGDIPTFQQVKQIFVDMMIDPKLFIADFRKDNLRIRNEKCVIIDFYTEEEGEEELHRAHLLKSWFMNNEILDKEGITNLINEFNEISFVSEDAKNIWLKTAELLKKWIS